MILILLGYMFFSYAQNNVASITNPNNHIKEKRCNDAELVVSDGTKIYLSDCVNGRYTNVKNLTGYAEKSISRVKIGDATGDGFNDIVVLFRDVKDSIMKFDVWSYNGLDWFKTVDGFNTQRKWSHRLNVSSTFEVGDTDGDDITDNIVTSRLHEPLEEDLNNYEGEVYKFNEHSFSLVQSRLKPTGEFDAMELGDIDGDKRNEIIYGSSNDPENRRLTIFKYLDGTYKDMNLCKLPTNLRERGILDDISIGDVDGDGKKEIIGSGNAKRMEVWDLVDNELRLVFTGRDLGGLAQANTCGDYDGDGVDEIIVVAGPTVFIYKYLDNDFKQIWSDKPGGTYADLGGASSGDMNGDGIDEFEVGLYPQDLKMPHQIFLYEKKEDTWKVVFQFTVDQKSWDTMSDIGDIDNKPFIDKK